MKKKISLIVAFCMLCTLVMCSCGTPSPTKTAETFLTAVKEQNDEALKDVYAGSDFKLKNVIFGEDDASGGLPISDKLVTEIVKKMIDFDYVVSNEVIKEDKATVDVEFTTYKFGSAISSFFPNYVGQAFALVFAGASEKKLEELGTKLLLEEINKLENKGYKEKVTMDLVNVDGTWKVAKLDKDSKVVNAMFGNYFGAINDIEAPFKD